MKKLVVSKSLALARSLSVGALLAKSQVGSYTRKDGAVVKAHDSGRTAAASTKTGSAAPTATGHKMHEYFGDEWHKNLKYYGGDEKKIAYAHGWGHANHKVKGYEAHEEPTRRQLGNLKDHYEAGKKGALSVADEMGDADTGMDDAFDEHINSYKPSASRR